MDRPFDMPKTRVGLATAMTKRLNAPRKMSYTLIILAGATNYCISMK
jgi:hypothetical protein